MANKITHISLVRKALKNNKQKLIQKDVIAGAIFPDLFEILSPKRKHKVPGQQANFTLYLHENIGFGKKFGKRLLQKAKTPSEISFAKGFISHFIIDDYVHGYFKKHKSTKYSNNIYASIDHLIIEYFVNVDYLNTQIPRIRKKQIPRQLIIETLKEFKADPRYAEQIRGIGFILTSLFKLQGNALKTLSKNRYSKIKKKTGINILDALGATLNTIFGNQIKAHLEKNNIPGFNMNDILYPEKNTELRKHINEIKKIIKKAEKECEVLFSSN